MKRRSLIAWGAAGIATGVTPSVFAQAKFPQRPVTLVVPTPPGGSTDFTARLIAEPLTRALGQSVIVDNRPGGAGNIGNQFVARSKPDGYTLLVAYSGYQVGNPHLFKDAGWDPIKDFAPVAMVTRAPQVVAIHHALPVNTLQELIAYAKKNPGKLNYASSGNGYSTHCGRVVQTTHGHVHHPYSLSRLRACGARLVGRHGGYAHHHASLGGQPYQVRAFARVGRHEPQAISLPARCTHSNRGRTEGI